MNFSLRFFKVLPIIAILLIFLVALPSCKNDLKLNAPYKEFPSIYAVINSQDRLHMIRVNKVFLGEGNANVMAKVADSVNYQPGELTITLNRFVGGVQVDASPLHPDLSKRRTIVFRDSVIQTESGAFSTNQRVYVSFDDLHEEGPFLPGTTTRNLKGWVVKGDYVLTVKNNRTGNIFTAKATAIDSVNGQTGYKPLTIAPIYPYAGTGQNNDEFVDYATRGGSIHFPVTNNAQIYSLYIRLHFYELFGSGRRYDFVDYTFNNKTSKDVTRRANLDHLFFDVVQKDFFSTVGISLSRKNLDQSLMRKMERVEFLIYSSSQEYLDFLEYSKPSFGLNQNKPLYSNFDSQAAIGIFTFRTRCSITKEMSTTFISEFRRNSNTCNYNFLTADESSHGCP